MNIAVIFIVFALVLFVLAAILTPAPTDPYRWRLIAAGLACYMASILFGSFKL